MTETVIASETYARWRATTLGAITERVETTVVFDLAGPFRGKRLLDVGAGDGTYAIEAVARGAIVTGLDSESAASPPHPLGHSEVTVEPLARTNQVGFV